MFMCWQCGSADTTERLTHTHTHTHTHIRPSLGWHSEKSPNSTKIWQLGCSVPATELWLASVLWRVQSSIFIIHPLICSTAGFNWASIRQSMPIIEINVKFKNVTGVSTEGTAVAVPLLVLVIGQPLLWRTSSLWTVFLRKWGWMDVLF